MSRKTAESERDEYSGYWIFQTPTALRSSLGLSKPSIPQSHLCLTAAYQMPDRFSKRNTHLKQSAGKLPVAAAYQQKIAPLKVIRLFLSRAKTRISKGEEITISYVPPYLDTLSRRAMLKEGWYFDCSCQRCSDASELGAVTSALKCQECSARCGHKSYFFL